MATGPTTLSGAAGASGAPLARRSRVGLKAASAGAGVAGVVIVLIVVRGAHREAPAAPLAALVVAPPPAPAPPSPSASAPVPPPAPPPVPPPASPLGQQPGSASLPRPAQLAPAVQVAPIVKDALARFVAWAHDHPGAPCPDAAILGAFDDPWGHPLAITCTDQPGDQIAGAISVGSDGKRGTADDIASWQLGPDVTDLVHGERWPGVLQRSAGVDRFVKAEACSARASQARCAHEISIGRRDAEAGIVRGAGQTSTGRGTCETST